MTAPTPQPNQPKPWGAPPEPAPQGFPPPGQGGLGEAGQYGPPPTSEQPTQMFPPLTQAQTPPPGFGTPPPAAGSGGQPMGAAPYPGQPGGGFPGGPANQQPYFPQPNPNWNQLKKSGGVHPGILVAVGVLVVALIAGVVWLVMRDGDNKDTVGASTKSSSSSPTTASSSPYTYKPPAASTPAYSPSTPSYPSTPSTGTTDGADTSTPSTTPSGGTTSGATIPLSQNFSPTSLTWRKSPLPPGWESVSGEGATRVIAKAGGEGAATLLIQKTNGGLGDEAMTDGLLAGGKSEASPKKSSSPGSLYLSLSNGSKIQFKTLVIEGIDDGEAYKSFVAMRQMGDYSVMFMYIGTPAKYSQSSINALADSLVINVS